ncbi:putative F-box protein PP2-B12 [Hibiscus syriacus]|uniref:F-box protein PP2-B12 n=1 Tax=Hibiscus syriacus TaxID=106335 RepID=A0A6A2Z483_HIBSY|nr:putative F-box protein PP2-B12 [Hibiscus syriacus]KAE8686403.1 putative F-box protein PP2-B12 [Hibiscus syriacus]
MKSEVSEMEGGDGGCSSGAGRSSCDTFALSELPQDCIAHVISFTSPRDACRLSLVSTTFKSAAESDTVWESFLPSEYQASIPSSLCCSSKKQLYLSLCENPLLINGGRKSLQFERGSGKKIYMLSARDLYIVWADTPTYWRWISIPESRFEEAAKLINVCWLEIRGKIAISMLSPMTHYKAYLVFKPSSGAYGFGFHPAEVSFGLVGTEGYKRTVYMDADRGLRQRYQIVPRRIGLFTRSRFLGLQNPAPRTVASDDDQYPKARGDGWLEVELGELFNDGCTDGELEMSVLEVKGGYWKGGLIVLGIEIRPNLCK